ncbi:hypothetical protein TZ03_12680 [Pseudomonas sp. 10-1B]|uniref:lipase chaperone n=1 Tax=Pseudomonas sp. 10-1B TaxID=1546029 RepID=UPI00061F4328|nr:lipase chaperone [Pseudomonas sp. 10-1B]KIY40289.1 hypothetical protein TZ03_12680 [Pseudomonas sp. 10-1B]
MSLSVNADFSRLLDYLKAQGAAVQKRTEDSQQYQDFLQAFGRATSKIAGILEEKVGALAAQGRLQVADGVVTAAADLG